MDILLGRVKHKPVLYDSIILIQPNKAHSHHGVTVRTLKLSCPFNCQLLFKFCNCLKLGTFEIFPDDWKKKGSIVQVRKKDNIQTTNNCRSVSLLPMCLFILCLDYDKKTLVSGTLSGFKPSDSCINELISRKTNNTIRPPHYFNNTIVKITHTPEAPGPSVT